MQKKTKTEISAIKTAWNLSRVYAGVDDPKIETHIQKAEAVYQAFADKYSTDKKYLTDERKLAQAISDYQDLLGTAIAKPYLYFAYKHDLNSADSIAESKMSLLSERMSKCSNKIVFFSVALSKISKPLQKKYLRSEILKPYRYFLKCVFDRAEHMLSEAEEKILNLQSLPAHELWVQGGAKLLARQTVVWGGKKIPIAVAIGQIASLPIKERHALHAIVNEKLKEISDFSESELNAIIIDKKIRDELCGFAKPYSSVVLNYENDVETVENLVQTVTEHFPIAHKFFKLKAKVMKLKRMSYADRNANIGATKKKIPFEKAVEIVRSAFAKVDPLYAETFDSFLRNGQIDVFAVKGKKGGAYCSSYADMPIYVLLNHLPDFNSVLTMAHEMGHSFHSKLSFENQPALYREYTISAAEVASTLFENFVFDEVFPLLSPQEQIVALHDKINGSIQTIFRQIACFNFELELHNLIRKDGSMSKENIAKLMNKHMQSYLGPVFNLTDDDGYFFVYWSHLRLFFYVYSYAFGELVSNAMYEMYRKDSNFKESIKKFLSAGGSDSPENIFASIGIDVRNPEFFKTGLQKIERDIERLEKLLIPKN
ncbi:MAG: M3 family oligoendopeptidase [bacterium]